MSIKHCGGCNTLKTKEDFYPSRGRADGISSQCKVCTKARAAEYNRKNMDKVIARNRKLNKIKRDTGNVRFIVMRKLGASRDLAKKRNHAPCLATIDQIAVIYRTDCEACGKDVGRSICLDHSHETGEFRAFLCDSCNIALGKVRDNPETLRRLADILERKRPTSLWE